MKKYLTLPGLEGAEDKRGQARTSTKKRNLKK